MNVYNTADYIKYHEKFTADLTAAAETEEYFYGNIKVVCETYRSTLKEDGNEYSMESTLMRFFRENKENETGYEKFYECTCNEHFIKPYLYEYGGKKYAFFKKDLYGYVILNLESGEEYGYFPSDVLYPEPLKEGEKPSLKNFGEAFIITSAVILNDILILEGCYWACPYEYRLLSLNDYKTYPLSRKAKISDTIDNGLTVKDNKILARAYDENNKEKTYEFTYSGLAQRLKRSKTYDI